MEEQTKRKRLGIVIGGSVVAAVIIIYLAFIFPWPGGQDVRGTIGGVKKAKKYRANKSAHRMSFWIILN